MKKTFYSKSMKYFLTEENALSYLCCMKGTIKKDNKSNCFFIDISHEGKRFRIYNFRGVPFKFKNQAEAVLTRIRIDLNKGDFKPSDYISEKFKELRFKNYAESFYNHYRSLTEKELISRSYFREIKHAVYKRFIPYFGVTEISNIGSRQIQEFFDSLKVDPDNTKKLENISPKRIKNIMAILKKLFQFAFDNEEITKIPKFPEIKVPEPKMKWLNQEEQLNILNEIPEKHKPIFLFIMKQGVRPSEGRAIQWQDIDFKFKTVTICRSWDLKILKEHTKNKKIGIIPLNDEVFEMLQDLSRKRQSIKKEDFVFTNKGKPYSAVILGNLWRRISKKLGYDITLYEGTRHSLASQAVNSGIPLNIIGASLRHSDNRTTLRYAHLNTASMNSVFNLKENKTEKINNVVKIEKIKKK